jgi:hypothetical protein
MHGKAIDREIDWKARERRKEEASSSLRKKKLNGKSRSNEADKEYTKANR